MRLVVAAVLLALAPAPALAADKTIQAAGTDTVPVWSPADVAVDAGDTVTWSFAGSTIPHNVAADSPNWTPWASPTGVGQAPASYTFSAAGTYRFVCNVHPGTMYGTVTVGNPPPPPPPPLSEQPFPNDAGAPSEFEVRDAMRPRLTHVRVRRWPHGARVRFRIDEPALVTLRVQRAGVTVKRSRGLLLAGRRTLAVRRLQPGAYRLLLVARDLAGNRSRVERARLTVR